MCRPFSATIDATTQVVAPADGVLMKTNKPKSSTWQKPPAKGKVRRVGANRGERSQTSPPVGHGKHLWKNDEDFAQFMAILDENSKR